jgi:hypothetical protein
MSKSILSLMSCQKSSGASRHGGREKPNRLATLRALSSARVVAGGARVVAR